MNMKKLLCVLMCAIMVVSILPAATAEETQTEQKTSPVTISKIGTPVSNQPGVYDVDLTVKGQESGATKLKTADIVLVLDVTASMSDDGLKYLKAATEEFLKIALEPEESNSRVAIIKYGNVNDNTAFLNQYTTGGSYFYDHASYTAAVKAGKTIVDIPLTYQAGAGSTNIMLGLDMADKILQSDECKGNKPVVVLMTDGAPNRAVKLAQGTHTITLKLKESKDGKHDHTASHVGINQNTGYSYGGPGGDEASYYLAYPNEDMSRVEEIKSADLTFENIYKGDGSIDANKITGGSFTSITPSSNTKIVWKCTCGTTIGTTYSSNGIGLMQATACYGTMMKNKYELWCLGAEVNTQTETMLKLMASGSDHYIKTTKKDKDMLVKTFSELAKEVTQLVTNASVTDPMGAKVGMVYDGQLPTVTTNLDDYKAGKADVYIETGSVTYDVEKETLYWTIGTINMGESYLMKYRVKLDEGVYGKDIPLNDGAILKYKDLQGQDQEEKFDDPVGEREKIETKYTVKHLLQNLDGKTYTESEDDRQSVDGIVGETTKATAKTFTGFSAQTVTQKTIEKDTTVVEIKYDRNLYKYNILHMEKGTTNQLDKDESEAMYGATITVNSKTINHYTYDSKSVSSYVIGTTVANNTASVFYTKNKYKVNYHVENDNPSADKTEEVTYGATIPDYTPRQDNYDFDGWYTDEGCTTKWTKPSAMPDSDIDVYGKFVRRAATLTITKKGMGADENAIFIITGKDLGTGLRVVVNGNTGKTVVSGLLAGETYTVTEEAGWSWRYTADSAKQVTVTADVSQYALTFTNTPENPVWFSGETRATNVFGTAKKGGV